MQVYQDAKCYLKGFFNAIEAFRSDREPQSWRIDAAVDSAAFLEYSQEQGLESPLDLQGDYPLQTKATSECYSFMPKLFKSFLKESSHGRYLYKPLPNENSDTMSVTLLEKDSVE